MKWLPPKCLSCCLPALLICMVAATDSLAENLFQPLNKVYDVEDSRSGVRRQGEGRMDTNLLHKLFNPGADEAEQVNQVPLQMLDGSRAMLQLRTPSTETGGAGDMGGIQIVSGMVDGSDHNMATLVNQNGNISGRIWKDGTLYRVKGDRNGDYRLSEINIGHLPQGDDTIEVPAAQMSDARMRARQQPVPRVDEPIDLMLLITERAFAKLGKPEVAKRELAMLLAETNNIYKRSGITDGQMFRLVGFQVIPYKGRKGLRDDLTFFATWEPVIRYRNKVGADLVAIMTAPERSNVCGVGFIGPEATNPVPLPELGISITDVACAFSNLSFAHELGHNLGARHDWFVDPSKGNNHGYVNQAKKWRTVMAYDKVCREKHKYSCPEVPLFSNPRLSHKGDAAGVEQGQAEAADNVAALRLSRTVVAAYRPRADGPSGPSVSSGTPAAKTPDKIGGIVIDKAGPASAPGKKDGKERKIKW